MLNRIARSVAVLFFAGLALAQVNTVRLEGTVQDSSGGVVPGTRLALVNNRTQVRAEALSNAQGYFIFPTLQPGTYTLTADAQGFRKATLSNIELNVGDTVSETIKLEVGPVADSVVVEASTVHVQTTDSTISRAVTLRDIDTLPQLGRGPIALASFQPGVQLNPADSSFSKINGMRQGSNNNTLDGVDVNDSVLPRLGLTLNSNNTDSVEEFRIITNGAKAEYGRNAGGQVELITRSGTNAYHGNLFEYLRNTDLNANTFFSNSSGQARPKFIQNTFGGSLGGPIEIPKLYEGKNKTFFFFNYQGARTAQDTVRNRTVPSDEIRHGVFRWNLLDAATGKPTGQIGSFDIFANDPRHIGLDKQVAAILPLMPPPNNFDLGDGLNLGGFRFNNPTPSQNNQWTAKVDHNLSSTHRIYYRISRQNNTSYDALNNVDSTFPGQPTGTQGGIRWGYAAGSNWVLKPWLVNEFLIGYQSSNVDFFRPRPHGPVMVSNDWTNPIQTGNSSFRDSPVKQINDNISILHGAHSFKTGLSLHFTTQYQISETGIYPNINFSRTTNGNAPPASIGPGGATISSADRQRFENLYNDLLARVSNINTTFYGDSQKFQPAGSPRVRNFFFHDYGFFFQDDWRLRPNLTLNIGLRWEFYGVPFERDQLQGVVKQAALINTVSQISDLTIQRGTNWYGNDWNNFAPRFGFSWDPKGDGKMAIRGSYGVFYDRVVGTNSNDIDSATPGFAQAVQQFPTAGGDTRLTTDNPTLPVQPATPLLTLPDTRNASLSLWDPHFRTPYVHQFNLTIQREIFRNTVLEVGYVGSRGVKLLADVNPDQRKINGDFINAFKEIAAFRNGGKNNGPAVSPTNTLVRIFGSVNSAISAIGGSTFDQGAVGTAAQVVDQSNFSKYAAAGVSDFYIRNYPQFDTIALSTNGGRSYYNSMQASVRRQAGALKFGLNYTFAKSIDNVSADGSGFTRPIDNFNLLLNRARSDFDRPHTITWSTAYTLPIGRGRLIGHDMPNWSDKIVGGWDLGSTGTWTSGPVMTVSSGRQTAAVDANTWANYSGNRNIGSVQKQGNGVIFWTPDQVAAFSFPGAGEIGTSGRNAFRGPSFFSTDLSVVKRFRLTEHHAFTFRAEAYNLFNHANFDVPGLSLVTTQSFGRISGTVGNARILQGALRYDF